MKLSSVRLLCVVGACALFAVAVLALVPGSESAAGLAVCAGFALLAVAASGKRTHAASGLAAAFAVYGGLSATIAVSDAATRATTFEPSLQVLHKLGIVTSLGHAHVGGASGAFRYALLATVLGGVSAVASAWFAASHSTRDDPPALRVEHGFAETLGRLLVLVGFIGIGLAIGRFAVVDHTGETPGQSLQSLWIGGSYALLVASFAVPGFGLWLHGLLSRDAARTHRIVFWGVFGVFGLTTIATGQRGFAIQLALVVVVVIGWHLHLKPWRLAALAVAGLVALGLTQAARNALRETGALRPTDVSARVAPDRWGALFGSQIASFSWTWDVARYRDQLDIPNTLAAAAVKPVPRQFYPGKVQGFGEEFTRRLYPKASEGQVSFATPLVAEVDYSFGMPGVITVFALLGSFAGLAEIRLVPRSPAELRPVMAAALVWVCFVLIRGDFANATFVSAAWVLPLAVACAAVGFLPRPRSRLGTALSTAARSCVALANRWPLSRIF